MGTLAVIGILVLILAGYLNALRLRSATSVVFLMLMLAAGAQAQEEGIVQDPVRVIT